MTLPTYKGLEIELCSTCNHAKFLNIPCEHKYLSIPALRVCPACEQTISVNKARWAIYCSKSCQKVQETRRSRSKKGEIEMKNCVVCKKKFYGNGNKRYCSKACHDWARTGDKSKENLT